MTTLRPSNASRWMECGGSVALCANVPDYHDALEDTAAEEGTAAHWVFEQLHRGHDVKLGSMTPNHVIVTDEMLEFGRELSAIVPEHATVEQKVDLTEALGMPHQGTLDVSWHRDGVAHILDYKFGHRFVDEYENWQVLTYFAHVDFDSINVHTLNVHIYQPRCYDRAPHRVWALSVAEYRERYLLALKNQVTLINAGVAPLRAGKHCYMCPAAASCSTLSDAGYGCMDELYVDKSPHVMNSQQLARELDALDRADKLLNARRVALEEQAHHVIRGGALVPGWSREQSQGRLAWTKSPSEVIAAASAFGKDISAPVAAMTPTQALKAGLPQALVDSLSERPPGKMKLKKVDSNLARKVFAK